jgi:TRAP-type C4-dicarboxylate transport system permease small subunit
VKVLNHLEEIALVYVSLALAFLIVLEICLRSTGITAFFWLEELGRYVLVFTTLCGACLAVRYDDHPAMTAVLTSLPPQVRHAVVALVGLFLCFVFAYLDYYTWFYIAHTFRSGFTTSTLTIPFFIPYLPIGVFIFFMSVRYLIQFFKEIQALKFELTHAGGVNPSKG